jgi:spermidine synthase
MTFSVHDQLHIVADFYGCSEKLLEKKEIVENIFKEMLEVVPLSVISSDFYQFSPVGVTGFIMIEESHVSVHTWPEKGVIAIDIFTCGDKQLARDAYQFLKDKFKPTKIKMKEVVRFEKEQKWIDDKFDDYSINRIRLGKKIFEGKSKFQTIKLFDTPAFGKLLVVAGDIQSAEDDEFVYHESLVHPALILHPNPKKVLILGAGEAATGRESVKYNTVEKVVAVDIDKEVMDIVKKELVEWHKNVFDNPKYNLVIDDAKHFVEITEEKFDVVISDLTDPVRNSPVCALYTEKFYNNVKQKMTENGIFVTQAHDIGSMRWKLHYNNVEELKKVFKYVTSYCVYINSFSCLWGFIIASDSPIKFGDINKTLQARNVIDLKYYDQESHTRAFSLPKYIREKLKKA